MNLVLDSLKTRLSFRWLGHSLGLIAVFGFFPDWKAAGLLGLGLLGVEAGISLFDARARRLKALAPEAFPFKNLPEDDRAFLQGMLLGLPKNSVRRTAAVWLACTALLAYLPQSRDFAVPAVLVGLPIAAISQYLGLSALGRRIAPFYFFEGDFADSLSRYMPSLRTRLLIFLLLPLLVLLPVLSFHALFDWRHGWLIPWSLAMAWAAARSFQYLVVDPIEQLGMALGRFGEGDYTALLDVTSGDELGVATQRYNRTVRSTDRRFFIRENFGNALSPAQAAGLFEGGLKLDGEAREVAVLAFRLLGSGATPKQFNLFCMVIQAQIDKFGGTLDEVSFGLVVAQFNAPLKLEQSAEAAATCAWEAAGALKVFCSQQKMRHGVGLEFGVGLAFGQAAVGLAGPEHRQRYTVLGPPAIEARELSQHGGLCLDDPAAEALGQGFSVLREGSQLRLAGIPPAAKPETI